MTESRLSDRRGLPNGNTTSHCTDILLLCLLETRDEISQDGEDGGHTATISKIPLRFYLVVGGIHRITPRTRSRFAPDGLYDVRAHVKNRGFSRYLLSTSSASSSMRSTRFDQASQPRETLIHPDLSRSQRYRKQDVWSLIRMNMVTGPGLLDQFNAHRSRTDALVFSSHV